VRQQVQVQPLGWLLKMMRLTSRVHLLVKVLAWLQALGQLVVLKLPRSCWLCLQPLWAH